MSEMKKTDRPISIDVFCGVGGMSLGFEQAGFDVVAAFDLESRHVETYRANFRHTKSFATDLSKTTGADLRRLAGVGNRTIDVLFGGPPCQGFSVGGKRDLNDRRNTLLHDFARLVRQIRPRYFVIENVEGLLLSHARPVLASFSRRVKRAGYKLVEPIQVLDAADFGVPQRRRRTFLLGCREELPPPTYPSAQGFRGDDGREYFPRVRDAIADLPEIELYDELFESDTIQTQLGAPSHYARLMRGEIVEDGDASAKRKWAAGAVTGCLRTRHSRSISRRFATTPPGEVEPVSRYHRLDWDGLAPTIRAGTGNDHGKHTAPRPIHPARARCITVREAARLHTFPDWFQFHPTRWHAFRQIGNAVPPRLARFVAAAVAEALQENEDLS
jgi:DNA (cytosine-5)-methyltransferase 1